VNSFANGGGDGGAWWDLLSFDVKFWGGLDMIIVNM
jgi:hypothetical protein